MNTKCMIMFILAASCAKDIEPDGLRGRRKGAGVDEAKQCPSPVMERERLASVVKGLIEFEKPGFESWAQSGHATRATFVAGNKKYTVTYQSSHHTATFEPAANEFTPAVLTVEEQPYATSTLERLVITDNLADGCVNSGIGDMSRLLRWHYPQIAEQGLEHHAYWQERYALAIAALEPIVVNQ